MKTEEKQNNFRISLNGVCVCVFNELVALTQACAAFLQNALVYNAIVTYIRYRNTYIQNQ